MKASAEKSLESLTIGPGGAALFPVELSRLTNPKVVWSSIAFKADSAILGCLPIEGEIGTSCKPGRSHSVRASAEFYGGAGLGGNAGGVRAANLAGVQLKGVGQTPLAGTTTDRWHKHGALSLQDAAKEVILSGVFAAVAPYGAVRSLAIVSTGTNFRTEVGESKSLGSAPRALLLRESVVRLGHFMRSSFCAAPNVIRSAEVDRMRVLIPAFSEYLSTLSPVPGNEVAHVSFRSACQGLVIVFRRYMRQVAVLRARRFVHGSLIPSNLGIDGRLVDFTTSSALPSLDSYLLAPGGYSSDRQHHQVLENIEDIVFYISKFDIRCRAERVEIRCQCESILESSIQVYDEEFRSALLKYFGFTDVEISSLDDQTKFALLGHFRLILSCYSSPPLLFYGGNEHELPEGVFDSTLRAALLSICIECERANDWDLSHLCSQFQWPSSLSAGFHDLLLNSYRSARDQLQGLFREESADEAYVDSDLNPAAKRLFSRVVRIVRLTDSMRPLYRRELDESINARVADHSGLSDFINSMLECWCSRLSTSSTGQISLEGWLTSGAILLKDNGIIFDTFLGREIRVRDLCGQFLNESGNDEVALTQLFNCLASRGGRWCG